MRSIVLFALLAGCPFFASAESIASFTDDIVLDTDGSIAVTETIEYDFGESERHGIFRDIPDTHPQESGSSWKRRIIDIDITSVTMDGAAVPYEVSADGSGTHIKIGDPDRTITGMHTYVVAYRADGAYSFLDDGTAELYWNATGNRWEVPIAEAQARVHAGAVPLLPSRACYRGAYGANEACELAEGTDGSVAFAAESLDAGEGLTIAVAVDGSAVSHVVRVRYDLWPFLAVGAAVLCFAVLIIGYRYRTRYRDHRPVIAQYEPYEDFKPMYAGMLLDGRLDPRDITAGIVYLAQQGILKIRKIDRKVLFIFEVDDYEFTLMQPIDAAGSPFLEEVLQLIFPRTAAVGAKMTIGELRGDTSKRQSNSIRMQTIKNKLRDDMKQAGFLETNGRALAALVIALIVVTFTVPLLLGTALEASASPVVFIAGVVAAVSLIAGLILLNERMLARGYEARNHLRGFKLFLEATEKERYAFHNAPEKSPEQFMEFLPYAIAFGVEKKWAEAFRDITLPAPDWYESDTASFSAANLSSSLGAFSNSLAVASGVSGTGGSGSSGGGFSGGGGGGGGGGSW